MDDAIKNLKALSSKYDEELGKIREKIRLLDGIPKAKALLDKCFKYKNGFSFGGNRKSWVYKHIVAVAGEHLIVDTFQMEGPNKYEFTFHEIEYISRFAHPAFVPISKKQYMKMFNKLMKHVAMLGKHRIDGL